MANGYSGILETPSRAIDAKNQSFGQGQQLLGQSFLQGPYGQQAFGMLSSPQGMDPSALEAMKSEAAQTIGGANAGALDRFAAAAGSSGAGGSPAEQWIRSQIQAGGGRDLLSAIRELNWLNEQAKLQQQGIGAGLTGQYAGIDANARGQAAQAHFNRQFPMVQGLDPVTGQPIGGGPGGGQFGFLNAAGQPIQFYPPGHVKAGQPLSDQDRELAMQQMIQWRQQNGGN